MDLTPGAAAVHSRSFGQADFDRFAALSGDDNPIHVDAEFAARTRFGRTVAHGMLLYSTICRYLHEELGSQYAQVEQELMFVTPTYTDEEVTVRLAATAVSAGRETVDVTTVMAHPDGSIACQGRALMALRGHAVPVPDAALAAGGETAEAHRGLRVGQEAIVRRVFTPADLQEYVSLTGDARPAGDGLAEARVPGGLLGGLFSFLLGTRLPGRGTNWLKQRLVYPVPCYPGEEVAARVEVVRLRPDKDLVNLRTTCTLADGRTVCRGEALVLVKDLEAT